MLDFKHTMPCLALSTLYSPLIQPEVWSGDHQWLLSHLVLSPVSVTFVLTQETQRVVQQNLIQIHSARKGQALPKRVTIGARGFPPGQSRE